MRHHFKPTQKVLHEFKVPVNTNGNIFRSLIVDTFTNRGNAMCYVSTGNAKESDDRTTGVNTRFRFAEDEKSAGVSDTQITICHSLALHDDYDLIGVTNVIEEPYIAVVSNSNKHFSKRRQVKSDTVRRFQYVAVFPSNSTIIRSLNTNGIKNSPISQRDTEISQEILGPSRHACQGKSTCTQPDRVDATLQKIDAPGNIK